jgi:hypothetical protein
VKSPDGCSYCTLCDRWIFSNNYNKNRLFKRQKSQDIVLLNKKRGPPGDNCSLDKIMFNSKKPFTSNFNILNNLYSKLNLLSIELSTETDINRIKEILETMKLNLEVINTARNMYS